MDGGGATGNAVSSNYVGHKRSAHTGPGEQQQRRLYPSGAREPREANVISGNNGFAGVAICGNLHCGGGGGPGHRTTRRKHRSWEPDRDECRGKCSARNEGYGVSIDGAPNTVVGGSALDERNVIANNVRDGVVVFNPPASGNMIRFNSIFENGGLGIDLIEHDEVVDRYLASLKTILATARRCHRPDAGSNDLQNFPVLSAATQSEVR